MTPALADALRRAKYIYLTTYSRAGQAGTVPTWLWPHEGHVSFTTQRASLKARKSEPRRAASSRALSRQAKASAARRRKAGGPTTPKKVARRAALTRKRRAASQ